MVETRLPNGLETSGRRVFRQFWHISRYFGVFAFGMSSSIFQKKNRVLGYSWSNKTWWKPHFPIDQRPLVEGCIANFGIFLEVFEFLHFGWFWMVLGYLWSTLLWYGCYYSHRSRDALSPVCRIFLKINKLKKTIMKLKILQRIPLKLEPDIQYANTGLF